MEQGLASPGQANMYLGADGMMVVVVENGAGVDDDGLLSISWMIPNTVAATMYKKVMKEKMVVSSRRALWLLATTRATLD